MNKSKKRCVNIMRIDDIGEYMLGLDVLSRPKGNNKGHKGKYVDAISSFDIETSVVLDNAVLYLWNFAITKLEDDKIYVVIGRTWEEFETLMAMINDNISSNMLCFVHNLSYEFQFLKTVIEFYDVFAMTDRKILRAMSGNIEFRCSYLQSGVGLSKWADMMEVHHRKLSGEEFNYFDERLPDTKLSYSQYKYGIYDVVCVIECILEELKIYNDTLYSLPLTVTGYIRREIKKSVSSHFWGIKNIKPSYELFNLLREGFKAGDVHANIVNRSEILENVKSMDMSSAHPFEMVCEEFPVTEFKKVNKDKSLNMLRNLTTRHKAFISRVRFFNINIKDNYIHMPIISYSKSVASSDVLLDNGRVIYASVLEYVITDIEFMYINTVYRYEGMDILELYYSTYGKLPKEFTDLVLKLYDEKTSLKGVDPILYTLKKRDINSCFGCMVENYMKENHIYNGYSHEVETFPLCEADYSKQVRKALLPYQWGVWVAMHTRCKLYEVMIHLGKYHVYNDTDSIKYVGNHDDIFAKINAKRKDIAISNGAFAKDSKGKIHYMGVFEDDGFYNRFITLGAKKYCYEDDTGLHITTAGVNKKKGKQVLEHIGGIEKYKDGVILKGCGGSSLEYNDIERAQVIYKGKLLDITSNVVIRDDDYTLHDGINLIEGAYDDLNIQYEFVQE